MASISPPSQATGTTLSVRPSERTYTLEQLKTTVATALTKQREKVNHQLLEAHNRVRALEATNIELEGRLQQLEGQSLGHCAFPLSERELRGFFTADALEELQALLSRDDDVTEHVADSLRSFLSRWSDSYLRNQRLPSPRSGDQQQRQDKATETVALQVLQHCTTTLLNLLRNAVAVMSCATSSISSSSSSSSSPSPTSQTYATELLMLKRVQCMGSSSLLIIATALVRICSPRLSY